MRHQYIKTRAFNQPLMVQGSYLPALLGAIAEKVTIDSVSMPDGQVLTLADIQAEATDHEARRFRPYQLIDGVAIVPILGSLVHKYGYLQPESGMTGYDGINARILMALEDPLVKGILLDHDSPGGECAGAFALADHIAEYRQIKPIWSLADELSASASYLLASACDRIVAPAMAQVGSIGVICMHTDLSQKNENEGIKITIFRQGPKKCAGNPFEPLPDDAADRISAQIDKNYGAFVTRAADGRGLSPDAIRETESQVFDAQEALSLGLIDEILPASDVVAAFAEFLNQSEEDSSMSKPQSATKKPSDDPVTAAYEQGFEEGVKAGTGDERSRIAAILNCEEAAGRQKLALSMATTTDNDLATCKGLLKAAAEEKSNGLGAAMKTEAPPKVSASQPTPVNALDSWDAVIPKEA